MMKNLYTIVIYIFSVGILSAQMPGSISFNCLIGSDTETTCVNEFNGITIFSCMEAIGCPDINYCWYLDTNNNGYELIDGETNTTLDIPSNLVAGEYKYIRCYSCGPDDCSQDSCTAEVTLLLNPNPEASLSPPTINTCEGATPVPNLTFTGSQGNPDFTFTYNNGGGNMTISTSGGSSSVDLPINNSSAGVFMYNLVEVEDANGCISTFNNLNAEVNVSEPLTFELNLPTSVDVCIGQSVDLSVMVNGGIGPLSYQWQRSSTDCSSGFSNVGGNSDTYNTGALTNTMYYRVIVSDIATGCQMITSNCITVNISSMPNPTISYNSPFCDNDGIQSVIYGGTGAVFGSLFTYTPINKTLDLDPITGEIDPSISETGMYTITYTTPIINGCTSATTTTNIVINPSPDASLSIPTNPICSGVATTISVNPSGGNLSIISGPGTLNGNLLTGNSSGNVRLKYAITAANGCSDNDTLDVGINQSPTANITSVATPMCPEDVRKLTGMGNGNFSVSGPGQLLVGDSLLATGPGNIMVVYTVTSANSCSATDVQSITVNPIPDPNLNSVDNTMCIGDSQLLSGSPSGGNYMIISGQNASNLNGSNITAIQPGIVTLSYEVTVNNCTGIENFQITNNALPLTMIQGENTACKGDNPIQLMALPGGNSSYQWSNNSSSQGISIATDTPISSNYSVTVTDNSTQCEKDTSVTITVFDKPELVFESNENDVVCDGDIVVIRADALYSGTISNGFISNNNWDWSYNWSSIENTNQLTINTNGFGAFANSNINYTLDVVDINGCTDNLSNSFYVNETPLAVVVDNIEPGINDFVDQQFSLSAEGSEIRESGTNILNYCWNFEPSLNIGCPSCTETSDEVGFEIQNLRAIRNGKNTITLSVKDDAGCAGVVSIEPFFKAEGCSFELFGNQNINFCTGNMNDSLELVYKPSSGDPGNLLSARFYIENTNLLDVTINQNQLQNKRFKLALPSFLVPGQYDLLVEITEVNNGGGSGDGCLNEMSFVTSLSVQGLVEVGMISPPDSIVCDTGSYKLNLNILSPVNPTSGTLNLRYSVKSQDLVGGNVEIDTFVISNDAVNFRINIENADTDDTLIYEYQLIDVVYTNLSDDRCNLNLSDSFSYLLVGCGCSVNDLGGGPGEIEIINGSGVQFQLCEYENLNYQHKLPSTVAPHYDYFVSNEIFNLNETYTRDFIIDGSLKELTKTGKIEFDSDIFNFGTTYFMYIGAGSTSGDCVILGEPIRFTYYPKPELSLSADKATYCENQIAIVNARNEVNFSGQINQGVDWLTESNNLSVTALSGNNNGAIFFDRDLIGGATSSVVTAAFTHEINGVSCIDTSNISFNLDGLAPDTSSIIYWPGNILASTLNDGYCFKWGYHDKQTNGLVYLENETSQFLHIDDSNYPFLSDDILNTDRTYFVDTYFANVCESEECVQRIYFTGEQFLLPREEDQYSVHSLRYKISPNPTKGLLNINISFGEENVREYRVYSISGGSMSNQLYYPFKSDIDVSQWPPGTYILELITFNGRRHHSRFIKY